MLRADSIWQRRVPEHAYLFVDAQARQVGDLLTVVVSQSTDVQNRDDRELNKASSASESFSFAGETSGGLATQSSGAGLDLSNDAERGFKGGATFTSERAFLDRFTVRVVDVLPNGNLVISGKRRVWVTGDQTVLVLTGVVRAIDVTAANTIPSQSIADLHLSYESDGPERHFTRQGWLSRRVNRWNPL
ncbi:MAG: flagellar basal body L-ring protein FlgH [Planctomycetaceae bacterium]